MNIDEVKTAAQEEIDEEDFKKAVEKMKKKIRSKKWWHIIFPFKLIIIRRNHGY